jgi:16S rRNA pseudouridine516 synthase
MRKRLDQWLANLGYASRSEARSLIGKGRVTVDGVPAKDPGSKVSASAVLVDGQPLDAPDGLLILLHKPAGVVCSHDPRDGPPVYDLLPDRWRRRNPQPASVGRLDKDTTGTLLITDQSALIHRWTSPRSEWTKVYRAELDAVPDPSLIPLFASGTLCLPGDDKLCRPAVLELDGTTTARITLTEGRYHQVKRMFAVCGLNVLSLHRTHFGPYCADDLAAGTWRLLPIPS